MHGHTDGGISISEDDIDKIPEIKRLIMKENRYIQALYDYAMENYKDDFYLYRDECPDNTNVSGELYFKQVYTWLVTEKVLPSRKRTILEEFVEKYVVQEDPDLAEGLSRMGDVIRGSFKIVNADHYPIMVVDHIQTGKRFKAVSRVQEPPERRKFFINGEIVNGKIYPWWRTYYMFNGILTKKENDYEFFKRTGLSFNPDIILESYERSQVEKYESISIRPNTTLLSVMNKFPSYWIDAMCTALDIDKRKVSIKADKIRAIVKKLESGYAMKLLMENFSADQLSAIRKIKENGWIIKYGQLSKQFSTEINLFWNEHPPESDIGILRQHGFVIVGKLQKSGRYYRVALIPLELREQIEDFFSKFGGEQLIK